MPNIKVITTCTKKKIATPFAYLRPDQKFESQEQLTEFWNKLLESCPEHKKIPAVSLYKGRGFKRVLRIVDNDPKKIGIVSAGLGYVSAEDNLVPYNLTTSIGTSFHVKNHITLGRFDVTDWWNGISPIKIHDEVAKNPDTIYVIAMSRSYLEMIIDDLLKLEHDQRQQIRIVGNDLEQVSDYELFDYIMPYDLRLNSINSKYSGSKIDFAQRAAHHLVNEIIKNNPEGTAKEHQQAVFEAMESFGSLDEVRRNQAIPNEDLRDLILREWKASFGKLTRLLGLIRQKYGFSCSENRLRQVMDEIKADIDKGIDVFADIESEDEE